MRLNLNMSTISMSDIRYVTIVAESKMCFAKFYQKYAY
jgi:hypothetical protein